MADGSIFEDFNPDDVVAALTIFRQHRVDSIAVAFMNSYVNPQHECATEAVLRQLGFEGRVSLSHRVSREYREYERTTTTVVDAFVGTRMAHYLARLQQEMLRLGFDGTSLITRSGSGSMTFADAARRPFETIMSGPVAGAEGAAELARRFGLGDIVTADVGGTSFDTALIVDGRPELLYQGEIMGLPLQTTWVDVHSIGSGGGSIAHVDAGGLLHVGPQSAGASPGPACYGRGGQSACTTDAAFFMGMLGDGRFRSGLTLDRQLAGQALARVGELLDKSAEQTAIGIITIAAAAMSNAIRELTVERGIDPAALSMMAFGGGGGMMATLIASELGIERIIIPPYAGNFSAWGLLGADVTRACARTQIAALEDSALRGLDPVLDAMFAELASGDACIRGGLPPRREVSLDLRYDGQEHALTVPVSAEDGRIADSAVSIRKAFVTRYKETFGGTFGANVEIVCVRATLRQPLPALPGHAPAESGTADVDGTAIAAYSFSEGRWMDFTVIQREELCAMAKVSGPAIVNEQTSTTYVDAGFSIELHESGSLFITSARAPLRGG